MVRPVADWSVGELMVVAASREIRDGEVVFVGMRLPLLAYCVAKRLHAPSSVGLFENGVVRDAPTPELLYTMSDTPNIVGAVWCTRMVNLMGLLQRGDVDVGFIGGAQVDRYGNVNSSYIGDPRRPRVKLPGSGGAADIASLARRLVVILPHGRHRVVERVDFRTSPGYGDGPGWRERVGLPRGGPSAVITDRAVFRFDPATCEMVLHHWHPGQSVEDVLADTGWRVRVAEDAAPTPEPTEEELRVLRKYDPQGVWTGRNRHRAGGTPQDAHGR